MLSPEDIDLALKNVHSSDENRDTSTNLDDDRTLTRIYLRNLQALGAIISDAKAIEVLMIAAALFERLEYKDLSEKMRTLSYEFLCHECGGYGVKLGQADDEPLTCPYCNGNGISRYVNQPS